MKTLIKNGWISEMAISNPAAFTQLIEIALRLWRPASNAKILRL